MTTAPATSAGPVRVPAHRTVTKRLGHWTSEREFDVRAHRGHATVDLRSPRIPAGDITLSLDLDHASLTLLVPDGAVLDDWGLRRSGRGKVKDAEGPGTPGGRRIVLSGQLRSSEIRVRRGGLALLTAMCSREFVADARQARREGRHPTVHDPAGRA
ncbi:MAG: hypothetical protein ACM32E_01125 [Gemmatimonadota bacterium]